MKRILVILFALYLTGCATPQIYSNKYIPKQTNGIGHVYLSVTEVGDDRAFPDIHIRNIDSNKEIVAKSFPLTWDAPLTRLTNQKTTDFENEIGTLILLKLPKGKYEVFKWSIFRGSAQFGITTNYSVSNPVYFEVKENNVTYVGGFELNGEMMAYSTDKLPRDKQSLSKKFVNLTNVD